MRLRKLLAGDKDTLVTKISDTRGMGVRAAATMILFCGCAIPGLGQFSGPSLGVSTPVNTPVTITTDQSILYPADQAIHIGIGDQLAVHLFGTTDFTAPERVGLDGSLQIPLIGVVPVLGLTLHEASDLIADRLKSAGMYRNPQITIQVVDSPNQVVTVSGEMHGVIPVAGRRGLLSVLSAAGAFPLTASHTVIINRPGVPQAIVVDLGPDPTQSGKADVPVFAHDTIVVTKVGVVYLLGAFKSQTAIPLSQNSPLTLMQATALGGGTAFEGNYKDLRIIRTVGLERKVVRTDIKQIMKGKEPDPVLQADDIVFLPTNALKASLINGGFGAATSLASLLLVAFQNR